MTRLQKIKALREELKEAQAEENMLSKYRRTIRNSTKLDVEIQSKIAKITNELNYLKFGASYETPRSL